MERLRDLGEIFARENSVIIGHRLRVMSVTIRIGYRKLSQMFHSYH